MSQKIFSNLSTILRNKKLTTLILFISIMIIGIFWFAFTFINNYHQENISSYLLSLPDRSKIKAKINQREYLLEVVNTPSSIVQGLSDRREIGSDGMLFVMPDKKRQTFWMPRMNFDLDILWLDEGTIAQISRRVPAGSAGTPTWKLPLYTSQQPVNLVLEIPSGRADLMGIKVGDQLKLDLNFGKR